MCGAISMAGSVIMDISYGLDIRTHNDPYLERAQGALDIIDQAGNPGSWLVDLIPACTYRARHPLYQHSPFSPQHLVLMPGLLDSEARPRMDPWRRLQA